MNSKLEKMTLSKLLELKDSVMFIIDSYTNELSTYGFLNDSNYNISNSSLRERELFEKRNILRKMYDDIFKIIEKKVYEYV